MDVFEPVRKIGLGLPGVEEGTSWGQPALKANGTAFANIATHSSAEPGTLCVRMDFERRDELIAGDPDVYYLKEHYLNYPCVLVRLARIQPDALRDLLAGAHRHITAKAKKPSSKRKARSSGAPGRRG